MRATALPGNPDKNNRPRPTSSLLADWLAVTWSQSLLWYVPSQPHPTIKLHNSFFMAHKCRYAPSELL